MNPNSAPTKVDMDHPGSNSLALSHEDRSGSISFESARPGYWREHQAKCMLGLLVCGNLRLSTATKWPAARTWAGERGPTNHLKRYGSLI